MADLLALSVLVSVLALLYARREYRRRGHLSLIGLFLLCMMLFLPNLLLYKTVDYALPVTAVDFVGLFISVVGLALCLQGMIAFGSVAKVMCLQNDRLTFDGAYQWSRNPQYVGWLLCLLGFSLNDWSQMCLAVLLLVMISLHYLVLIEEEHLRRVFGDPYVEFCRKVPRYWSWRR